MLATFRTFTVRRNGDAFVRVAGELDMPHAHDLEEALDGFSGDGLRNVFVDMSEVDFVDSSGLRVLERAHARLAAEGTALVVSSPSPEAARVLTVSGLGNEIQVTFGAAGWV